ncbi:hypothetical protein MTR67_002172 [Solanum verrucosum]|uniref:Uncharacterized protein n=1 Tax=Solanum verrucosum TaxID=315347 RepID=A0AAF0PQ14_SOLVR|nr:hypothetical protein MTR67_002172 [Solanum verrucosum]
MGGVLKSVDMVQNNIGQCSNDAKFEAFYNEEVQYLRNQIGEGGGGVFSHQFSMTRWKPRLEQ